MDRIAQKLFVSFGLAASATAISAGFLALMIYLDGGPEALRKFLTLWGAA